MTPASKAIQRPAVVLALFVCAHSLLAIDRSLLAILAEPIKLEFRLSDTQVGILGGIGFSLFFGIGGIPIGMLVDRFSRRRILAGAVLVFSGMTGLSALTQSFVQILIARSIVGAGEAGGTPSMGSMLADLYPPEKRASAMSVFYAGNPIGAILAFLIGGTVAAHYGWRAVFLVVGIPGVLLALILLVVVREPVRQLDSGSPQTAEAPRLVEALRFIGSQRALCHILFTPVLTSAASAGVFTFAAAYFIRSYGLSLPQVGLLLAIFYGSLGVIATIVLGPFVDRMAKADERWRPWFCALANAAAAAAIPLMTMSSNLSMAIVGLGCFAMATTATYGPLLAMLQSLVGPRMRGMVTAILYLLSYLLGASGGPWIVGRASDYLKPHYGAESLRYAIALMALFYAWGAVHFFLAGRKFRSDLARASLQ